MTSDEKKLERCGIAKLLGTRGDDVLEFFMKNYTIVLGRNSKNCTVDVVLGDSMSISRKHASITYNFESRRFELMVMGKNGVHKDGELFTPEKTPVALNSGDRIKTGDCDLYFLLPSGGPVMAGSVQPPRNGIGSGVHDPMPNPGSPMDAVEAMVHAPNVRDVPERASAAIARGPADAMPAEATPPDGSAGRQAWQHAATPNIANSGTPAAEAAVMDAVAAYCAAQGNGGQAVAPQVGADQPQMMSKIAEALSALPPQQLQGTLPPQ